MAFPSHTRPPFDVEVANGLKRNWSPPPHDLEHNDHSPKGPHSQSTGHASVLQICDSVLFPSHARPPFNAGEANGLERDCSPPLHDLEHVDHSP